ncbi:MAG: OmpA family protein [Flavobacteriales bacterium]|nr:OmpA family protein [Flavobacteriales bacterium]
MNTMNTKHFRGSGLLTIMLLLSTVMASAQQATPESTRRAQETIKQADKYFRDGGVQFTKALPLYEEAYEVMPDNADLNVKIGICHLNGRYHYKALPYFQKAVDLEPMMPRVRFLLAYSQQLNGRWDAAIENYTTHKRETAFRPDPETFFNMADKRIAECRHGKAFEASPVRAQVENLGQPLNGELSDYGCLFMPDGRTMYFTSRRPNTTGGKINKATSEYFEDIYVSRLGENGWSEPEPLAQPVNTVGNDATVGLCMNGTRLLIYRDEQGMGDLWMSDLVQAGTETTAPVWGAPVKLPEPINSKFHESSAWMTEDGEWLYFVSDRPGGVGGQDIWRSQWMNGAWAAAENLGPDVNSILNEDGVFITAEGSQLYFSSKGHTSMGEFDVFVCQAERGAWSRPRNMGWPVNSPDDDLFFVLAPDGQTGYVSSVRHGGVGDDDMFRVHFLPPVPTEELLVSAAGGGDGMGTARVVVNGVVKEINMLKPIEAQIEVVDLADASVVARMNSLAETGGFTTVLSPGRSYAVHVKAQGYLLHSETMAVPEASDGEVMNLNIPLTPLEAGRGVVLHNIFFARDQAALGKASLTELGQLLEMLRMNPALKLEIAGHTDSDGTAEHNKRLSRARAQAVVDHLLNNGVEPSRLIAKGYGADQPVAENTTDEGKARNRRTEMRVLVN